MRGSWFARLKKSRLASGASRRKSRREKSFQPRLEMLESRLYLSAAPTFIVNTTADPAIAHVGVLSLREAVHDANAYSGAKILLAATGTYKLTLIDTDGDTDLDIFRSMSIAPQNTSLPASKFVIDGHFSDRVFDIDGGLSVSIKRLTIEDGRTTGLAGDTSGGAIYMAAAAPGSSGSLTLTNVVVRSNSAYFSGGGVFVGNGNSLALSGDTFSNNLAGSSGGGGAVAYEGKSLSIDNCTFSSNSSTYDGGAVYFDDALDGGPLTLSVTKSTFSGNTAVDTGGGIYIDTTGSQVLTLTVTKSTFTGNTATNDAGGGIALEYGNGTAVVSFTNSKFTSNAAYDSGGGAYLDDIRSLSVSGCTFTGNRSDADSGGGIYAAVNGGGSTSITKSTFTGNYASDSGGAVFTDATTILTITYSTFADNTSFNVEGGGVYAVGDGNGSATIQYDTFTGNVARTAGGGAYLDDYVNLTITSSTFAGNTAQVSSGVGDGSDGVGDASDGGGGGGIYAEGSDDGNGALSLTSSSFTGNVANADGGGAFIDDFAQATVSGGTFTNNKSTDADGGGAFIVGSGSSSNLTLSGSSFSGNACYENGGGAFVNNFTNATLGGDTFSGNLAGNESLDGSGGGAFLYGYGGGTLSISKTTFTGNNSYNAGGGAYIAYFTYVTLGTAPLGGDTFSGNQARDGSAGGAYVNGYGGGNLDIFKTSFSGNRSYGAGGGAYLEDFISIYVNSSSFTANATPADGAGLYAYENLGSIAITGSTFSGNTSTDYGGGAYLTGFLGVDVQNNTISNNRANTFGGGLYVDGSSDSATAPMTFTLTNNVISGNTAADDDSGGGVFYAASSSAPSTPDMVTISNNSITGNFAGGAGGGLYLDANDDVQLAATIAHNTISNNTLGNPGGNGGGGLYLEADDATDAYSITLTQNTVANNKSAANGGGLSLDVNLTASGGGTPLVSITANTFSGNRAANDGGGLYLTTTDTNTGNFVKMINNTVSGNSALFDGGGIYADTASFDSLKLVDDTIAQNNAGSGGGVYVEGNVVAVVETIIASNVASSQPAGYDVYGAFADEGNNLIGIVNGSTSSSFTVSTLLGAFGSALNPELGKLANNGGPTQTMKLLVGSPAIHGATLVVVDTDIPTVDQRGVTRGTPHDIGAYD